MCGNVSRTSANQIIEKIKIYILTAIESEKIFDNISMALTV